MSPLCRLLPVTPLRNVVFVGAPYFLPPALRISSNSPSDRDGSGYGHFTNVFLVIVPSRIRCTHQEANVRLGLEFLKGPSLVRLHLKWNCLLL